MEELQMQNLLLMNALHNSTCPKCGGPVPRSDVQQPRVDAIPPQQEALQISSDDSIDQEFLRREVRNLIPASTKSQSLLMPSEILPGPAHDLIGVYTDQITGIVTKAKDELLLMATAGYPLWISSPSPQNSIHPETLNYGEYLRVFQRGGPAPYFRYEASRHSATIHLNPTTIVHILMNVGQWLPIFCNMVTNAKILEVLSPGEEESYKEQKQVMSAEFLVATPNVPTREVQFIRYSHQQLDGSWIVVDVSVDELQSIPRPSVRSICQRRPSGCLIRDLQNGSSFVTWLENIDVRDKEKELDAKFKPFVESGFAFGAQRWVSTLQRQAERFRYSMGINTSPGDTVITAEGRRSLATMANKMMVNFCADICNSTQHHWSTSNKTRRRPIEVKTNKRRGDPGKPPGRHRTAGCTVKYFSHYTRVFDFLRDVQKRPLWESMSMGSSIHVLANVTTGLDPRNCISVFAISNHNDFLILQECCTDATGSYVIHAPIDQDIFQSMLCGADPEIPLMSSGFSILPDVSEGVLDGTLVTIVFQISDKKAVDVATAFVRDTLRRIKAAIN